MMQDLPDEVARERFRTEIDRNFAVNANAGSGKTTALSRRLAAMALSPSAPEMLRRTVVVTFTRKAAAQIRQRARSELFLEIQRLGIGSPDSASLLDSAFFGTIHSFCLMLAQRYGSGLGVHLNPKVVEDEDDDDLWERFLEQDPMTFKLMSSASSLAFLRHAAIDDLFGLARRLDRSTAHQVLAGERPGDPAGPDEAALVEIRAAEAVRGGPKAKDAVAFNKRLAEAWVRDWHSGCAHLPFAPPRGTAAGLPELFNRLYAPVKRWVAAAGLVMAAELAVRYRRWRIEQGLQTYTDQIDTALSILHRADVLDRIRAEGYRILLDEAQDTDPQQFAVLVEITRPPGARVGAWPGVGEPPRSGHFCMVGDAQQSIYGSRADLSNFRRHLEAFAGGDGGGVLTFSVTFRIPCRAIGWLNEGFRAAFGAGRPHNLDPVGGGGLMQVPYIELVPGPGNSQGCVSRLTVSAGSAKASVEDRLAEEVHQVARRLKEIGPEGIGARDWSEVCILAPRNDWLFTAERVLAAEGFRTSLQLRRSRAGDAPAYAWICGLVAIACDCENTFEWTGVLREVFGVADATIAEVVVKDGRIDWENPERLPQEIGDAVRAMRPFLMDVDSEGMVLGNWLDRMCRTLLLSQRLAAVDPGGAATQEMSRILAWAEEVGAEGGGPREFLGKLLGGLESGRASGRREDGAIGLLTCHSAKGLEWPVVIPLGLWRPLSRRDEPRFRSVRNASGIQVYFDGSSEPLESRAAREAERLREQVRLLYVALTRVQNHLIIPWHSSPMGGSGTSLAEMWGGEELVQALPELAASDWGEAIRREPDGSKPRLRNRKLAIGNALLARRILPHELADSKDAARSAAFESVAEGQSKSPPGDPVDYGIWWHEVMEHLPWGAPMSEVELYIERIRQAAFTRRIGTRASAELLLLRKSASWRRLHGGNTRVLTEVGILASVGMGGWVDGVIDLVAVSDPGRLVLVLDWKTNKRLPGESADDLVRRLTEGYKRQLEAYVRGIMQLYPQYRVESGLYITEIGRYATAGTVATGENALQEKARHAASDPPFSKTPWVI